MEYEGGNLLEHWLNDVALSHVSPTPIFDVEYYCHANPDVNFGRLTALQHYLHIGVDGYSAPCKALSLAAEWAKNWIPCMSKTSCALC